MRVLPIVAGLLLVAAFLSLGRHVGYLAELGRDFVFVGWREALFWLAHLGLATPGLLLVGYGLAPRLAPWMPPEARPIAWPRRRTMMALALYGLVIFSTAVVGRSLLLLDMPITDDENTVRFAGAILAEGELMAPTPQPRRAFPLLFTYERQGRITSIDFPGGIVTAAAAQRSGLGSLLYALMALVTALAVVDAGRSLGGTRLAWVVGAVWLVSPMVSTLSMTTHSFLVARTFVALAVAAWARIRFRDGGRGTSVVLGLVAGGAFLCRPLEAICLLTPLAWTLWRADRQGVEGMRWPWRLAALGFVPAVVAFAAYNAGTTGVWYRQARFMGEGGAGALDLAAMADRLGGNLGWNLVMLAVWLMGPVGVAAVAIAVTEREPKRGSRPAVVPPLALGAGLALTLSLLHDDTGLHAVGPIHYSDTAVVLALLASIGLLAMGRWLVDRGVERTTAVGLFGGWLAALMLFQVAYAPTLRTQAEILRLPHDAVAQAGIENALVIADPQHELWDLRPALRDVRSWMIQFPHPDPYLRDDVLFVYPSVPGGQLVARFPDRDFYRMTYQAEGESVVLERLMVSGR